MIRILICDNSVVFLVQNLWFGQETVTLEGRDVSYTCTVGHLYYDVIIM